MISFRLKRRATLFFLFIFVSAQVQPANSQSILDNSIDKYPAIAKNLSIYFIDLSGSVDHNIVLSGLNNVKSNVANTYAASDAEQGIPADSYYEWIPIQGAEANSSRIPLFNQNDDYTLWTAVTKIKGKKNQLLVIRKLWQQGGLWSQLITQNGINTSNCSAGVAKILISPGVSGIALSNLSKDVCAIALRVRSRFEMVTKNVQAFTGTNSFKKTKGTDLLGTIRKLETISRNSAQLGNYENVQLIFVSDMIHQTSTLNMEKELLNLSREKACDFGRQKGNESMGFNSELFRVTIYGLGEKAEGKKTSKNSRNQNEILYEPLLAFWDCFWIAKKLDLPDSEFRSISTFKTNN